MSLSKTQRLKLELERRGLSFPLEVNMGMYNRHNNVYRARLSLKTAQKALKERKLEEVMDECKRALFLLSVDRVQNPLVEIDVTSSITALVMETAFLQSTPVSRKVANDWAEAVLDNDLRSDQLASKMMRLANGERSSAKRALCIKVAAMCGNAFAAREHRAKLHEKEAAARAERSRIPDRRFMVWGSGEDMGRFVPKPVVTAPGPDVPETPAAAPGVIIIPGGMEGPDEGNHGLINRLDAPPVPVVDFPLPQDVNDEANRTVDISSDEEDEELQATLGERVRPEGQANVMQPAGYSDPTFEVIDVDDE